MRTVRIGCQHKHHGAIFMSDHPGNNENLESFMDALRAKGCVPDVESYDDERILGSRPTLRILCR